MNWEKDEVIERLKLINEKGFIGVPADMFRKDDGVVGQILEKEFGITENNLHLADLGKFELKGMRHRKKRTNLLTLFHQKPSSGLTPIEIFERFGYIRKSNRSDIMKKKLFTTVRGDRFNSLGFILKATNEDEIKLFYKEEHISTWNLSIAKRKVNNLILVFAETCGATNSHDEQFHFIKAYLLDGLGCMANAVNTGAIVIDFCIDQPADCSKGPHDRGPHIRIPIRKLPLLYENVEELL